MVFVYYISFIGYWFVIFVYCIWISDGSVVSFQNRGCGSCFGCGIFKDRSCGSCFGCGIFKNRGCGSNAVVLKMITAVAVAVIT